MKYLIIVLVLLLATPCFGKQVYNSFENRWETIPDNANWTPRYNGFDNTWEYQPNNTELEYNGFENTWDWKQENNNYDYDYNNWYD